VKNGSNIRDASPGGDAGAIVPDFDDDCAINPGSRRQHQRIVRLTCDPLIDTPLAHETKQSKIMHGRIGIEGLSLRRDRSRFVDFPLY
jgi:hypothetical protein